MTASGNSDQCITELKNLQEDATFSAQSYFESAKSSTFWGRSIVFGPAVAASVASMLVALGAPREIGALSAIAGAISATSSFLGSTRTGELHMEGAKEFTRIRHAARMEISLALDDDTNRANLESTLRSLRSEYDAASKRLSPVSNRFFRKAQNRIGSGVLQYEADGLSSVG